MSQNFSGPFFPSNMFTKLYFSGRRLFNLGSAAAIAVYANLPTSINCGAFWERFFRVCNWKVLGKPLGHRDASKVHLKCHEKVRLRNHSLILNRRDKSQN